MLCFAIRDQMSFLGLSGLGPARFQGPCSFKACAVFPKTERAPAAKLRLMKLGYTIIYVPDVPNTVAFYGLAFGLTPRFVHESNMYAELETGETALAFAANEMAAMNGFEIVLNAPDGRPAGWEVCLVTDDVDTAYAKAVDQGCQAVSAPQVKPWGQTVSYVRDLNGCLVEIASPIAPPV